MTQRWKVFLIAGLAMAVLAAAIYFPILRRRVMRAAKLQQQSQEQARRELIQPVAVNPADPRVKTSLFWASDAGDSTLAPVIVELALSRDPVPRFFRSAGDLDSLRDRERTVGGGFHHADAGGQRAAGAAAENPDSWAGSGNIGGASGSDRRIRG